jgi:hypothetical protein
MVPCRARSCHAKSDLDAGLLDLVGQLLEVLRPQILHVGIVDRMLLNAAVLGRLRAARSMPSPGCGTVAGASGTG